MRKKNIESSREEQGILCQVIVCLGSKSIFMFSQTVCPGWAVTEANFLTAWKKYWQ